MLYLSSIVKYGFVRDIPGRSENAVPMARRHAIHRLQEVGTVKKWNLYFCTGLFFGHGHNLIDAIFHLPGLSVAD